MREQGQGEVMPAAIPAAHWGTTGGRVWVKCPACGGLAQLDHEVDASGRVTPSLACPQIDDRTQPQRPCSYHRIVTLDGWPEGGSLKVF